MKIVFVASIMRNSIYIIYGFFIIFFKNHFLLKIISWLLRSIWLPGVHCIIVLYFQFFSIIYSIRIKLLKYIRFDRYLLNIWKLYAQFKPPILKRIRPKRGLKVLKSGYQKWWGWNVTYYIFYRVYQSFYFLPPKLLPYQLYPNVASSMILLQLIHIYRQMLVVKYDVVDTWFTKYSFIVLNVLF